MQNNTTNRLNEQQVIIVAALLATPQFTEDRKQLFSEADRIVKDPSELERLSSTSNIAGPTYVNTVQYLNTIQDPQQFKQQDVKSHWKVISEIFAVPSLKSAWTNFTTRLDQVISSDHTFIETIARTSGLNQSNVKTLVMDIKAYSPSHDMANVGRENKDR